MIVYRQGAIRDLAEIARWYRAHRPHGEGPFFERFRAAVGRIEEAPTSFPLAIEAGGVRKARMLRADRAIAFIVEPQVEIVAVVHGARRPGFWTRRLDEDPNAK